MPFNEALDKLWLKVLGWADALVVSLPNLVLAFAVLVIAWALGNAAFRGSQRLLGRWQLGVGVRHLLSRLLQFVILGGAILVALSVMGLDRAALSFLAGAGIVGLALGFAFQDLAANFISGVVLAIRKPFVMGDIIETDTLMGMVQTIDLRNTTVRTFDGRHAIVPNRALFENTIFNCSVCGSRRLELACGVSYGEDLGVVQSVATKALESLEERDVTTPVAVHFTGFGDSSIDFVAHLWFTFRSQADLLRIRSEAVKALKRAFDEAGITIPFPIRTLDFGIKGGTTLAEMPVSLRRNSTDH